MGGWPLLAETTTKAYGPAINETDQVPPQWYNRWYDSSGLSIILLRFRRADEIGPLLHQNSSPFQHV